MVRLLTDENFNDDVVDGLLVRRLEFDLVRVQDVGLARAEERVILAWAAANERILLTDDKVIVPNVASERVRAGESMPGVLVADGLAVWEIIEEVLMIDAASEQAEWADQVWYLPLN